MNELDLGRHGLVPSPRRPEIPGGPQTIAEVLEATLREEPDREALVGRHARYRYAELDEAANRAARCFADAGVAPGDRIAVSLPNDTEIVVAFLGAMRLGAIWVGVNRALAPPEKAYLLRDCGARLLLADRDARGQLEPRRAELPELVAIFGADPGDPDSDFARALRAASPAPLRGNPIDPFAPAAIAYTSGTTGFPKGAVHSQHNLLLPGAVAQRAGTYGPEVAQGVVLPLTILNLVVLGPLVAFQCGSACVAMDRIDALGIAEWVRSERIGHFAAVPTVLHDLLTHPDVKPADLATLRRPEVGGADCPEAFRLLYRERFGTEVQIGYGLTEAPTAVTRTRAGDPYRAEGCGRACPQVAIHIRDEQDRPVGTDEVGEVCVGPASEGPFAGWYTPFLGYWNQPEASREALRGGLLRTGDLGALDGEGDLRLRGRRKELILRGGANVYPAEIERVLHAHERVIACAVIGVPDPRLGERVVAYVQSEPGISVDAEALRAHCAEHLARYKVPSEFRFVREFPRNAMGKIRKTVLRDGGEQP